MATKHGQCYFSKNFYQYATCPAHVVLIYHLVSKLLFISSLSTPKEFRICQVVLSDEQFSDSLGTGFLFDFAGLIELLTALESDGITADILPGISGIWAAFTITVFILKTSSTPDDFDRDFLSSSSKLDSIKTAIWDIRA